MNVITNAAVTCCALLSLLSQSVRAQDPKLGPFPETISKEAKAFLIRTKGNIINNYILQDGAHAGGSRRHFAWILGCKTSG